MQGFVVRGEGRWKNLEAWFDAMETRPTYLATRSDHYTHVHDLPPQLGGIPTYFIFRSLTSRLVYTREDKELFVKLSVLLLIYTSFLFM